MGRVEVCAAMTLSEQPALTLGLTFPDSALAAVASQQAGGGLSARPVVKWAGGKRALLPALLSLSPQRFRCYFEPFLGGASFFLALRPAQATLGDANAELIGLYCTVRDSPSEVMAALDALQPFVEDPESYYRIRSTQPASLTPPQRAARFIFLNKAGFNGLYRVNRRGEFNVPFGTHASRPTLYDAPNLAAVSRLLRGATLKNADFEDVLGDAGEGDFAYLDPPYAPLTPTANFTQYTSSSFSEGDQTRLASAVQRAVERGCHVLVSNSDTALVRALYGRYKLHRLRASRNINSDGAKRQKITELAIQAYPA